MTYKIYVPGYIDIASCETFKEIRKALDDGGCMHRITAKDFDEMTDALLDRGVWVHKFADDPRFNFIVEVI